MIRITDRTLSCLDDLPHDKPVLLRFLACLIEMGIDTIELSQKMYDLLLPLPEHSSYLLRIKRAVDIAKYARIEKFICMNAPSDADERIYAETRLNNIYEIPVIARFANCKKLRIQGMDNALCDHYLEIFTYVKKYFCGDIEFCPTDRFHCATALATEWATNGMGNDIVTSFGGIGGFAPTEELIMILRMSRLRHADKTYAIFPCAANLFNEITGKKLHGYKPIIGKRIFNVESGVHVDGILKQPKCYEPFPPEIVGQTRKIVLGKQSGTASIRAKLSELNIECAKEYIPTILEQVKIKALENNGAISDKEFAEIVKGCQP